MLLNCVQLMSAYGHVVPIHSSFETKCCREVLGKSTVGTPKRVLYTFMAIFLPRRPRHVSTALKISYIPGPISLQNGHTTEMSICNVHWNLYVQIILIAIILIIYHSQPLHAHYKAHFTRKPVILYMFSTLNIIQSNFLSMP